MGSPDTSVTMFSGKGGVGKTTCAATAALHHSMQGRKTLIISTDPTPSLSHIFEVDGREKPVRVQDGLYLAELGLAEVKQLWDRKFGRQVYEVFSSFVSVSYQDFVEHVTSILPGLADEFMVDYIKELAGARQYEAIVWDTAPLGQTLGLLETPSMLRQHLRPAPRIYSKLKLPGVRKRSVLDIIGDWEKLSAEDMEFLKRDVSFSMVAIPEALAVQQLEGVFAEFGRYGFNIGQLTINHVVKEADAGFLRIRAAQQQGYLRTLHERYSGLKVVELPAFPYEIKGIARLKEMERRLFAA